MHSPVTFTESYDLDRRIEDFIARRSSALAAESRSATKPIQVDFVGLDVDDRRVAIVRSVAGQLGLRLRFC